MWMFEQGGMTPHRALIAGTINGARYIGMEAPTSDRSRPPSSPT